MSDSKKWPRADALVVANQIVELLAGFVDRAEIAGSIRREKPMVGDIEILYIPILAVRADPEDLFGDTKPVNLADKAIAAMEHAQILQRRLSSVGHEAYGEKNKLMRHVKSGIPVDLFATSEAAWYNYLVCRTGGADSNVAICTAAIARGEKWNPYGPGFTRNNGIKTRMTSEEAVFKYVGLPCLPPSQRR